MTSLSTSRNRNKATEISTMNTRQRTNLFSNSTNLGAPGPDSRTWVSRGVRAAAALGLVATLAGCSSSLPSNLGQTVTTGNAHSFTGQVYGGQQPISGATIQLYTVGTTGTGSASTALLTTAVTTGSDGSFAITGDYSCSSATQVYITATGGNPGAGGTNTAANMVAALGSCATLQANAASTFINLNEVTTVAAAYALAPFATDYTHIGATGSNPTGLVNAFANAALLANTSTGSAGGNGLATGVTVPTTELNSLADILAACVNTSGSTSSPCNTLMTATGATDTFGAALGIAKNPGASSITALTSLITATAPFQPYLSSAPSDYSVAVTFAGSGVLSTPYAVAIDASGNAWVANESSNNVTAFSPTGTQLSNNVITNGYGAQALAFSTDSSLWVAATASNTLQSCVPNGSYVLTCNQLAASVSGPTAIAFNNIGQAWVANLNGNSVAKVSNGGSLLGTFSNNITNPTGVAIDGSGNVYVTSGLNAIVKLSDTGAFISSLSDFALQGPFAIALDPSGNVLASGFTTGTVTSGALMELGSSGTAASVSPVTTANTTAGGLATDGTSIWQANSSASGGLLKYAYGASTVSSPATGYGSLNAPVGVAVDVSGSVWTANSGSNTLSKFIGIASPAVASPVGN